MKPSLRLVASILVLAATGLLLVADVDDGSCNRKADSASFVATGTCGPTGNIQLSSQGHPCTIETAGMSQVTLPTNAQFGTATDFMSGGWTLSGYVVPGSTFSWDGGSLDAGLAALLALDGGSTDKGSVYRECTSVVELGRLKIKCQDSEVLADGGTKLLGTCEDLLSQPTQGTSP